MARDNGKFPLVLVPLFCLLVIYALAMAGLSKLGLIKVPPPTYGNRAML